MQRYIFTCDDCGLSEGINRAALDLYEQGIPVQASVMANFPAAPHAVELFNKHAIPTGVHLNLTDGFPLTGTHPSGGYLRADGQFRSRKSLFMRGFRANRAFREWVQAELLAQVETLVGMGLTPDHLTTHMHFHILPALRAAVYHLAGRFSVTRVRAHRLQSTVLPFNPFLQWKSHTNSAPSGVFVPDYIVLLRYWQSYPPEKLVSLLNRLDGVIEIVVHPGTPEDDTFPAGLSYGPQPRFAEWQYFQLLVALLDL
ncbi:MAG: ChbG/HpnK family deacetylase [Anaerolineaceae bacterium]|nr:ChbG/HpnK family deacetylase [Anaerolineaceae bacterium]